MTLADIKERYEGMQDGVDNARLAVMAAREELERATEELAMLRIAQDGVRGAYIATLEQEREEK